MTETKKTLFFLAVAGLLVLLAFIAAPKTITPEAFKDLGTKFFPEFTDPNEATTMEVVDYDDATGSSRPFKVTFNNGRWTIPSHNDYPADGKDRLAKTAAGVIDINKDGFRTDSPTEYEAMGVVDPLDESSAGLSGRGRRVTIKGQDSRVLADFIIGNEVVDRPGLRFVRIPDEKRVYASKVNVDISARFEDWIEPDLLKVTGNKISRVVLKDYSINERTLSVEQRDVITLVNQSGVWKFDKSGKSGKSGSPDTTVVQSLIKTLDELAIVGVRPKPAALTAALSGKSPMTSISQADWLSLQSKGYYLTREGQLLSNEGELQFSTEEGLKYTLRFGEVAYGTGLALTAGASEAEQAGSGGGAENRYLFVSVDFDNNSLVEPPKASDMTFKNKPDSLLSEEEKQQWTINDIWQSWQNKVSANRKSVDGLNERFSHWYYVISSASFDKLRLKRKDLIKS